MAAPRMLDTRPRRPVAEPDLMNSASVAGLMSGGAEGGAAVDPTPRKRVIFAVVGACLGAGVMAVLLGAAWLIAHGLAPLLWLAVLAGGAWVGWVAAPTHVKRWGADGFPNGL